MMKIRENNGTEDIRLVTPTSDAYVYARSTGIYLKYRATSFVHC